MVQIVPFRGLRYNVAAVGDLSAVTAPPYDVIESPLQSALYERHPANIVRLILNRKTDADTETDNPYARAAAFLADWRAQGLLTQDATPALYAYAQTWSDAAGTHERRGLIGLLRLEPFESGQVLPHEATLGGPKVDRFKLMTATQCNLSQIFMIYQDPERRVESMAFGDPEGPGWMSAEGDGPVTHRMRPLTDADQIQDIQALFQQQVLLIADGHHRYETALEFARTAREAYRAQHGHDAEPGSLPTDYVMVFLANLEDTGLKVFPTHRVLMGWPSGWTQERFEPELLKRFQMVSADDATLRYRFSSVAPDLQLKIRDPKWVEGLPEVLRPLDVAQLEHVVFQGMFGMDADHLKREGLLRFYQEPETIRELLHKGEAVAAFIMQTPNVAQVKAVCQAGYRMPQKSTFFYPKLLSGLVLYPYA